MLEWLLDAWDDSFWFRMFIYIAIIMFAIGLIIGFPFLVIWALNTVFPSLALEYSWTNWAAITILEMAVRGFNYHSNRRKS